MSGLILPEKCQVLFEPHRYKVLHGGRGGTKSWSAAGALAVKGAETKLRVLCGRELQNSIKESCLQILRDRIESIGLADFYDVQQTTIIGKNGTEFNFEGLRYNHTKIKSYEGIDIAWIEQAERVSKASWNVLIPTVRKVGSEIWMTINPDLEEDYTYQRFILRPPEDAVVIELSWRDNPWFWDSPMRQEMEELKRFDPDEWLNVWEGKCRHALEGAIYATELREAAEQGRITRVPVAVGHPVHTAWDLGHSDATAIWFFQRVGFEYRLIDYHEDTARKTQDYLKVLQDRGYLYGHHYLPHDATTEHMTGDTVEDEVNEWSGNKAVVVPQTDSVVNDLNYCRNVFESCWFDQDKCSDGIACLRHYRYGVDEQTGRRTKLPVHDWSSHGADAFRTFAVGFQPAKRRARERPQVRIDTTQEADGAWLGI